MTSRGLSETYFNGACETRALKVSKTLLKQVHQTSRAKVEHVFREKKKKIRNLPMVLSGSTSTEANNGLIILIITKPPYRNMCFKFQFYSSHTHITRSEM